MTSRIRHIRPGFIYAATRPGHPGWFKVGFTRRSPARRAQELSGTSITDHFTVVDARFVWDAPWSETQAHTLLARDCAMDKEFFQTSSAHLKSVFSAIEELDATRLPPRRARRPSAWTEDAADDVSAPADWIPDNCDMYAAQLVAPASIRHQDKVVVQWERFSAEGHAESSLLLAEHWMKIGPTLHPAWEKAQWLFRAAIKQGDTTVAPVRAAFWHSQVDSDALPVWWSMCATLKKRLDADDPLAPEVLATLIEEQGLWAGNLPRAQSWSAWQMHQAEVTSAVLPPERRLGP